LKNIIILAYFFPPANFVASDRIAAWAKHLHQFGYYPTIITRNWNDGQKELTDRLVDNSLKHEINDTYEVYRLPYHRTWRDKLNDYPHAPFLSFFRRTLSMLELVFNNFWMRSIPYSNFYDFTKQLILDNPGKYNLLIASGGHFQLFFLANRIKKATNIKWLADYRDEWSTYPDAGKKSVLFRFIAQLEAKSELNWTANCDGFITVSEYWKKTIGSFIKKNGFVVMNGYSSDKNSPDIERIIDLKKLEISYIGTLYKSQQIEVFIQAITQIINTHQDKIKIVINFIGIESIAGQEERIKKMVTDYPQFFNFYKRMPKNELARFYANADLLLATNFSGIKGWYPVKIFEYSKANVPILLCPNDFDVMEKYIKDIHAGYVVNSAEACVEKINELIVCKLAGKPTPFSVDKAALAFYSRENQTKILAEVLNQIQ